MTRNTTFSSVTLDLISHPASQQTSGRATSSIYMYASSQIPNQYLFGTIGDAPKESVVSF